VFYEGVGYKIMITDYAKRMEILGFLLYYYYNIYLIYLKIGFYLAAVVLFAIVNITNK
jgi:hypothetical protein